MNEMITIQYENENPTVSGRELHAALEIETPYHKLFPRMLEYGFSENKDFRTFLSESSGWQLGTDHEVAILTLSILFDQFVFLSCGHPLLQIFIVRFLLNRYK